MTTGRADIEREELAVMHRLCLSSNLRKTERLVTRHYDAYLASADISAVQLPILAAIAALDEPSFRALAEALELDRSTLSRNLAVLEQRDLLSIGPSSGPKAGVITLTPAGRRTLRRAHALWRKAHAALQLTLSQTALNDGLGFLLRLRRMLRD
jgi:DNA-binding MarR family transcriptional regulator